MRNSVSLSPHMTWGVRVNFGSSLIMIIFWFFDPYISTFYFMLPKCQVSLHYDYILNQVVVKEVAIKYFLFNKKYVTLEHRSNILHFVMTEILKLDGPSIVFRPDFCDCWITLRCVLTRFFLHKKCINTLMEMYINAQKNLQASL